MRSNGEKFFDSLRLKTLKTAAQTTAPIKSKMPKKWFLLPSFDLILITETAIIEITVHSVCRAVALSFKKSFAKIITTTGTNAIITPESAEETKESPYNSKIKYKSGWAKAIRISFDFFFPLNSNLKQPKSHKMFKKINARVKRTLKIIIGCATDNAVFENIKLKPKMVLAISAARIP